jgi:hypothetical protein
MGLDELIRCIPQVSETLGVRTSTTKSSDSLHHTPLTRLAHFRLFVCLLDVVARYGKLAPRESALQYSFDFLCRIIENAISAISTRPLTCTTVARRRPAHQCGTGGKTHILTDGAGETRDPVNIQVAT